MIPKGIRTNFNTLLKAADNKDILLMECKHKKTGAPVYVVCAAYEEDGEIVTVPLTKMFDGNPYDEVDPPSPESDKIAIDKPADDLPGWTEHHKRVINIWECEEYLRRHGVTDEELVLREDTITHRRELRAEWLKLTKEEQSMGLRWYDSNLMGHKGELYLGHEEV